MEAEERLREELRQLNDELSECKEARTKERDELEGRMQDMRQKAKDTLKTMQERTQQVVKNKDTRIQELESEQSALASQLASAESRSGADCDAPSVEELATLRQQLKERDDSASSLSERLKEREERASNLMAELREREEDASRVRSELKESDDSVAGLRAQLQSMEESASRSKDAQDESTDDGLEAIRREAAEARANAGSLEESLRQAEAQATEAHDELQRVKRDSEAKIAGVVQKAKDHLKQVQSRLEASASENRELSEKCREVEEAYKQQQEKVTKYKQLMAQANSQIQASDKSVADLKEALNQAQEQRASLAEQVGCLDKTFKPPSRDEIAARGGIILAVETEQEDVWCLVSSGTGDASPTEGGDDRNPQATCKTRWWLMSQLDVQEKPVPIQRRWKGEVAALRAQLQRSKKKAEDLQEEFDAYKLKANAALQATAGYSEEISLRERRLEEAGAQLQTMALDLQQMQASRAKALEELADARRRLHDSTSQKAELERVLELRTREAEEQCSSAVEACRRSLTAEKDEAEQRWHEKERHYQQELDLRRVQRESLEEKVESLRARLASRPPPVPSPQEDSEARLPNRPPPTPSPREDSEARLASRPPPTPAPREDSEAPSEVGSVSQAEPAAEPPSSAPSLPVPGPPQQAYSLHTSVAWQDLVNLRSQVREMEQRLLEEKQQHSLTRAESESLKAEVRDLACQQKLHETVGQHQQMEYIRNVFRKFVEMLPVGAMEQEQLIPVLMTFFKFPAEEARAIQGKRHQAASGFWGRIPGLGR